MSAEVERPVTIAVLGTHSTGKSTFLARLAHELRRNDIEVATVADLGEQAQRIGLPILHNHTWASTLWIITRGISDRPRGARSQGGATMTASSISPTDTRRDAPPQPDLVSEAAHFLARYGDDTARQAMLAAHTPDATGRCRAAHSTGNPSPEWPCILHMIGAEAERLASRPSSPSRRRTLRHPR